MSHSCNARVKSNARLLVEWVSIKEQGIIFGSIKDNDVIQKDWSVISLHQIILGAGNKETFSLIIRREDNYICNIINLFIYSFIYSFYLFF